MSGPVSEMTYNVSSGTLNSTIPIPFMSGVLGMLCESELSDGEGGIGGDELQGTRRSTWTVCLLWDTVCRITTTIAVLNSIICHGPVQSRVSFLWRCRSLGSGQYNQTD